MRKANKEYNDEARVKEVILKFPQFAGYDHSRVVRQKSRLGRIVGLSSEDVIDKILDTPILASYSAKRYIAALDIGQRLAQEGFEQDMLDAFFRYCSKSPYVPGTRRQRISKAQKPCQEPPLLITMRKSLIYQSKKQP